MTKANPNPKCPVFLSAALSAARFIQELPIVSRIHDSVPLPQAQLSESEKSRTWKLRAGGGQGCEAADGGPPWLPFLDAHIDSALFSATAPRLRRGSWPRRGSAAIWPPPATPCAPRAASRQSAGPKWGGARVPRILVWMLRPAPPWAHGFPGAAFSGSPRALLVPERNAWAAREPWGRARVPEPGLCAQRTASPSQLPRGLASVPGFARGAPRPLPKRTGPASI